MTRAVAVLCVAVALVAAAPASAQDEPGVELALVVPIASPPLYGADGRPDPDIDERLSSTAATLRALIGLAARLPLALAPSPLLCDELRVLGEVAAPVVSELRVAAAAMPLLSAPYADVRLSSLEDDAVSDEIELGRERVRACAEAPPVRTLFPPDLALSRTVLDQAVEAGAGVVLAPIDRVRRRPLRAADAVLLPAAEVEAGMTTDDAYALFSGAERAVAVVRPGRPDLVTFLGALADDPRVTLRTLAEIADEPVPGRATFADPGRPPAAYVDALLDARRQLDRLNGFTLSGDTRRAVLSTWLARARSSAEWDADWEIGRQRADRVGASVRGVIAGVEVSGGSVTFTSRRGSIPVTITNESRGPLRLRVALSSPKLTFANGPSRVVTVEPPGDTVLFEALARSTGAFPVSVRVTSPDGRVRFGTAEVTVRSTAANIAALALTAGAALFLAAWYLRLLARRRRAGSDGGSS